jgi:hypothetical protein
VVSPDLDRGLWTPEAVAQAWGQLAQFIVSEWVDSELVWSDSDATRDAVALRIDQAGFYTLGGKPNNYMYGYSYYLVQPYHWSPWGPLGIDQNYKGWRESAQLLPSDGFKNAQVGGHLTDLLPARPAPYNPGQPREFITYLELTGVEPGNDGQATFVAEVDYERPLQLDGVTAPVYEHNSATFRPTLAWDTDTARLTTWGTTHRGVTQHTVINWQRLSRLPLLGALPVPDDWTSQQVGGLSFATPAEAVEDREACDDDEALQALLWDGSNCLFVYQEDPDPINQWILYPGTTSWAVAVGQVAGWVDVMAAPEQDLIDLDVFDNANTKWTVRVNLPSGTGQEFVQQLLGSMDNGGPTPLPPAPSATP